MQSLANVGTFAVGATVEAQREDGDDEYEPATVKGFDPKSATLSLLFADGFKAGGVPLSRVKLEQGTVEPPPPAAAAPPTTTPAADDAEYDAAVRPTLPTPPTAEEAAVDADAKYRFIAAYKDAGNGLFKAGKYAWAIRTYGDAVDALATNCYASHARMLWDYAARGPCAQCYSNAALCALKLGEWARAAALCEQAMLCKPEDGDLVKVLHRHGQALNGSGDADGARAVLERALEKEPANRAVREELQKAKKAAAALAKARDSALFGAVDLRKQGLTSKAELVSQEIEASLHGAWQLLLDGKDAQALDQLTPLLDGRLGAASRRGQLALALYCTGICQYHQQKPQDAAVSLSAYFAAREALIKEKGDADVETPLTGLPLARFYLAHALFNMQKLPEAQTALLGYLDDVAAAGPQRVLNMPDGWNGKKITEEDRKASRLRARAAAPEAVADAHTMLGLIAEREEGPLAAAQKLGRAAELAATDRQRAEIANFRAEMLEKAGGLPPSNEAEKERANLLLAEAAEQRGLAADFTEKVKAAEAAEEEKKKQAAAAGDGEGKEAEGLEEELPTLPDGEGGAEPAE